MYNHLEHVNWYYCNSVIWEAICTGYVIRVNVDY